MEYPIYVRLKPGAYPNKNQRRISTMSYVDELYERVVAQNPGEPEFHQAVKEVLDSLKLVIDANE